MDHHGGDTMDDTDEATGGSAADRLAHAGDDEAAAPTRRVRQRLLFALNHPERVERGSDLLGFC